MNLELLHIDGCRPSRSPKRSTTARGAAGGSRWRTRTAFAMLAFTLNEGMPIGVAYGIWTACGVALIAGGVKWARTKGPTSMRSSPLR